MKLHQEYPDDNLDNGQYEREDSDVAVDEDSEPGYCPNCSGSGEGMYDGSRCSSCKGTGEQR
jgi:DnaJ-class molecular chaperone